MKNKDAEDLTGLYPVRIKKFKLMNMKVEKYTPGEDSFLMRSACFIGTTGSRIHQIIVHRMFLTAVAIAVIYVLMHLTGISVEIDRAGNLLLNLK